MLKCFNQASNLLLSSDIKDSRDNNNTSNNNIIIKKVFTLFCIDFQLDIKAIGIIIVVNNTKYIDKPSTPK